MQPSTEVSVPSSNHTADAASIPTPEIVATESVTVSVTSVVPHKAHPNGLAIVAPVPATAVLAPQQPRVPMLKAPIDHELSADLEGFESRTTSSTQKQTHVNRYSDNASVSADKKLVTKRAREGDQEDSNEEEVPTKDLKSSRNFRAPVPRLRELEPVLEPLARPTRNSE